MADAISADADFAETPGGVRQQAHDPAPDRGACRRWCHRHRLGRQLPPRDYGKVLG